MAKVDLHLHSSYSDGSNSIQELLDIIEENNISIFALTDHDTTDGCREITKIIPDNIQFIPAVELTSIAGDIKCHVIGYNCDYDNVLLKNLIEKGRVLRRKKLETRIAFLKHKWNIELTQEEKNWLYSRNSVVKTHIANILVNRGLSDNNISAMDKYLDGCKTGNTRFSVEDAIAAIISSGGIPVWAHPLGGEGKKHDSDKIFFEKLSLMIEYGIRGLECFYSRYTEKETDFLVNVAKKNNLFISGGSDFHGKNKIGITPAQLNVNNCFIDSQYITILNAIRN